MVFSTGVFATERVANLYQAVIEVDSTGGDAISAATSKGLAEVFNKVSGQKAAINHPLLRVQYTKPKRFLSKYRYDINNQGKKVLVLDYEPSLINSVLSQADLPIWSDQRPSVLIWVVIDEGGKKRLLNPDNDPELMAAMTSYANRRGIPLKVPLFDLNDATSVSAERLWTLDPTIVRAAGQRYEHDALLIAKVNALSDQKWMGLWNINLNNQSRQFDGFKQSPKRYLKQGIDNIADQLAQQFAVSDLGADVQADTLSLKITEIYSFKDYRRALTIIESLDLVNKALPSSFSDNTMLIALDLKGSATQFKKSMGLYSQFQIQEGGLGSYSDLNYQWNGR